ncbi:hypothetical protein CAPTEDRAFT_173582 [Capitella teleta]|uniref:PDZ domain-containing protein n=1 Tax=Capitella teleta TaxID=283909 RepID=X1ZD54_CAPTE|nr:hypothetical protein CAPTEDRAFT_173582 [Capitella teleta]|eukprot:ELU04633.1 hypothetical protein CAPTEDRAFT_173582 [Capitella teleta]
MAGHTAGDPLECYGIPIVLQKEPDHDENGQQVLEEDGKPRFRCGFRIGGGIDQDPAKSPQGYPDKGVYITFVYEGGPAFLAGLQVHDKILQVNGHDFTVVTHKKAVEYIKRKPVLNMLIYRKGMPSLQPKPMDAGPPFHQFQQQYSGNQPQYSPAPQSPAQFQRGY